jgi:hypothetical protein
MSGLCWVSLTGQGLTAFGLPADGVSTHLLGVRPGSTATLIAPSMSARWRSNTCCRRSEGVVTGWRRTGDRVALHSLRAAHARSMFIQSSSTRRAPVGKPMSRVRSRSWCPEDAFARGLIDGRVVDCLSVSLQLRFHRGYVQRERDNHDVALLKTLIGRGGTT